MRTRNWAAALMTAMLLLIGCLSYAQDHQCKVVGWEVFSNSTPGGGGQPISQGLTGERTPWSITTVVPGTGVDTFTVRYYCCKQHRDEAIQKDKDDRKKAEEKRKKPPKGSKPPEGPNVPTFDPRFYELDENGKVVPKKPKPEDPKRFEDQHRNCDIPAKFEGSDHFNWWLKNHDHHTESANDDSKGRLILSGAVVAGQEASVSAVDEKGVALTGAVIELPNGQHATTNSKGIAKFLVPAGITTLILSLVDRDIHGREFVMTPTQANTVRPPGWNPLGSHAQTAFSGQLHTVFLDGSNGNYKVLLDGKPIDALSSSPLEATVEIPSGTSSGAHSLTVMADDGIVAGQTLQVCKLVAEPPKTFVRGQSGAYRISVVGTNNPVRVKIENFTPDVVQIVPEKGLVVFTSSVWSAQAIVQKSMSLKVRALRAGSIRILATPIESGDRWTL